MSNPKIDRISILRSFLEHHPLYAACRFEVTVDSHGLFSDRRTWPAAVTLACKQCQRETTWQRVEQLGMGSVPFLLYQDDDSVENYFLLYKCVSCDEEQTAFWCACTSEGTKWCVRKQGQSPPWSIEPGTAIAKALPQDAIEFYRKGLICTSHNFGLGAVGYFRRVVEVVTGYLLELVEENAKVQGDQATLDSVAEARRAFSATERLKHAASQLPATLRLGGVNPLARLYESYSEGIHSLTDEQCLEVARDVQAGIDYLLPMLHDQLAGARAYQVSIAKATRRK